MFVAVSCSKDAEIIIPDPEPVPPIVFTEVDVDLSTAAAGEFSTRAALEPEDEYAIGLEDGGDLLVLAFSHSEDGTGTLKYSSEVSRLLGAGINYTFTVKLELTQGTAVDLWFIANAKDKWSAIASSVGQPKSEISNLLTFEESTGVTQVKVVSDKSEPSDQKVKIPLWGVLNNVQVVTTTTSASAGQVRKVADNSPIPGVNLYRMVAKIDVSLDLDNPSAGHKLSSVILYNRNTVGSLVPKIGTAYKAPETAVPGQPAFPSVTLPLSPLSPLPADNDSAASVTYLPLVNADHITRTIYAFEISAAGEGASGTSGSTTDPYFFEPCLIVGAKFGGGAEVTWYRIPFVNSTGAKLPITRNTLYNVKISALTSPGAKTPDIALETVNVNNITATVVEWTDIDVPFPD
jgi:hypothetical protein